MKIIVHRGTAQIGGTCIEVATDATRIILDCGWPLEDAADQGPPAVPGLFAPGTRPDAVLLTHAHPDHTGFITEMPPDVPIYATVGTSKMMLAGSYYTPNGVKIPRDRFCEVAVPKPREASRSFPIGDLNVTAYPVDHSAYDSVAYLVEHGGKRVLYTGDLRFHGRKPGMSQRLSRELRGKLDLLITEGTNVGRASAGLRTEAEVEARALEVARAHPSLVMVAFSPQNIDRFVSFYRAAKRAGRTFVGDHYLLGVLHLLALRSLPKPGIADDLRFYFAKQRNRIAKIEPFAGERAITCDEILAEPHRYLMLTRPSLLRDFEGALPPKTHLLYGMWSEYRKRPDWQEAEAMIADAGGEIASCHASGHAHELDLFSFIDALRPRKIWPVHTREPEIFRQRFVDTCVGISETEITI
jgi:ribonuclease J